LKDWIEIYLSAILLFVRDPLQRIYDQCSMELGKNNNNYIGLNGHNFGSNRIAIIHNVIDKGRPIFI